MTAKTTRILKEARPLFWPWCVVVAAAVAPLFRPPQPVEIISRMAFVLGIPILATLSLGNEFQHRTLSLLLSQPANRMEVWREKMSVTVIVVVPVSVVFYLSLWWTSLFRPGLDVLVLIATVASATFWTLFARSTLGGVVLNLAVQLFIIFGLTYAVRGVHARVMLIGTCVLLCYAGVTLWLGRRKLARFEAIGDMAGDDVLVAGPRLLPRALTGWLRCRPTGAVLNLFRKEIRLLRPVWLITLLATLGWACLAGLGFLTPRGLSRDFQTAMASVGVISTLMIAILAGTLSLGEERTSGTHLWHLTLPVPARRQWLIKLGMALFAGFVGAGLVPLSIAGRLLGSSHMFADMHVGRDLLVGAVLLTFAAFWCACAVKGTVRAVLWVLPVMIALYFAGELGKWAGPVLTDLSFSRFDPFANVKFAHAVWRFGSSTVFFRIIQAASNNMTDSVQAALVLATMILVPTLLYAVIQSYRLFRTQLQDRALSVVRSLLPLAMTAFLCNFSLLASYSFVGRAGHQEMRAFFETIQAMQKIQSGAKLDAAHPLQLTVEDLAKVYPLSKSTRRFLGNSHITLRLEEPPHHGHFGCAENPQPRGLPALGYSWYSAVIPLADGSHIFVAFDPVTHYTISAGICGGHPPALP